MKFRAVTRITLYLTSILLFNIFIIAANEPTVVANVPANPDSASKLSTQASVQSSVKSGVDTILKNYDFLADLNLNSTDLINIAGNLDNYVALYTDQKIILIRLYSANAPRTVGFFKQMVRDKFYDGTEFFRYFPNYFIQAGDPSNSGYGGTGVLRPSEINNIPFERGTLAMSNTGDLNSDDTQFFITFNTFSWLDKKYSVFGKVISGIDYLESIEATMNNEGIMDYPIYIVKAVVLSDAKNIEDPKTLAKPNNKIGSIPSTNTEISAPETLETPEASFSVDDAPVIINLPTEEPQGFNYPRKR